jgi:ABC-type Fe3+ transport system substrate-binding protein
VAAPSPSPSQSLVEAAKKEGQVVWYVTMPLNAAQAIAKDFEQKYGIQVVVQRVPGETVFTRFVQENRAGKPQSDVLQGSDVAPFQQLDTMKMLLHYKPPTYDRISAINRIGDYAYGAYITDVAVLVNTNLVSEADAASLRSWQGILDPKWKGKIATVEPYLGGIRFSPWMYALYPTRGSVTDFKTGAAVKKPSQSLGEPFLKSFGAQKPVIYSDPNAAADALAKGQFAIVYPYFEGGAYTYFKAGAPVRWYFQDPTIGYPLTFDAISTSAPHPNAAKLFLNWAMSDDGAQSQLNNYGSRSSLDGVKDTRPFVKQSWYKPPVNLWGPDPAQWADSLKSGSAIWDADVKAVTSHQ